jgi:tRNA A37 threonylcarbamoyladenosine dehydratase
MARAQHSLSRTELLIGKEGLDKLSGSKVVVLGIGGVGSFTVEALARAGVGTLVLVDDDAVCLTNINRQVIANLKTVGKAKVEVMKERIYDINRKCNVITHKTFITEENIDEIITEDVDYEKLEEYIK